MLKLSRRCFQLSQFSNGLANSVRKASLNRCAAGDINDKTGRQIVQYADSTAPAACPKSQSEGLLITRARQHQSQKCSSVTCEASCESKLMRAIFAYRHHYEWTHRLDDGMAELRYPTFLNPVAHLKNELEAECVADSTQHTTLAASLIAVAVTTRPSKTVDINSNPSPCADVPSFCQKDCSAQLENSSMGTEVESSPSTKNSNSLGQVNQSGLDTTQSNALKAEIQQFIQNYEDIRRTYLLKQNSGSFSIAGSNQSFAVTYFVEGGRVFVDRKHLFTVLVDSSCPIKRIYLFQNWNLSLTDCSRRKCFGTIRFPNIRYSRPDSLLTKHGAELLLTSQAKSKPDSVKQIRTTLIQHGLLSPFEEMAYATKPQQTLDKILAIIQHYFPDLQFDKQKVIATSGGRSRKRCLDLWCDELKLNIECDENSHSRYEQNYVATRQQTIERTFGCRVHFHSYNPQSAGFAVLDEATRICNLISSLRKTGKPLFSSPVQAFSHDGDEHTNERAHWPRTQMLERQVSLEDLASLRSIIEKRQAVLEEMRLVCLDRCCDSSSAVIVEHSGKTFQVRWKGEKQIDGLIGINRLDLCQVISNCAHNPKTYFNTFKHWHEGLSPAAVCKYFAAANYSRKKHKPKVETEWLTVCGAESMLSYYRSTKPTEVNAVMSALKVAGLVNAYRELPVNVTNEAESMKSILDIVKKQYPKVRFVKRVLTTRSCQIPKRHLDAWCEELRLNVQCREHNGRPERYPDEAYWMQRNADIRAHLGQDTEFHYYNPLSKHFSAKNEANKLLKLIDIILGRRMAN